MNVNAQRVGITEKTVKEVSLFFSSYLFTLNKLAYIFVKKQSCSSILGRHGIESLV